MTNVKYEIHFTSGVEGPHLSIWKVGADGELHTGRRICGPKAWGGGTTLHKWPLDLSELLEAIPELAYREQEEKP